MSRYSKYLKTFTILDLPYIIAKKMEYDQIPNLSINLFTILYYYSTDTLLITLLLYS